MKQNQYILSWNNQTNKILGIGLIRNSIANIDKPCRVYDTGNYNRYVYMSKYRIDHSELKENELAGHVDFNYNVFNRKENDTTKSKLDLIVGVDYKTKNRSFNFRQFNYLAKPLDEKKLVKVLSTYLQRD